MKKWTDNQPVVLSLDDFGISRLANTRILKLISTGKINRVSVMMNGEIAEEDIPLLLASGTKIDIHLDLKDKIDESRMLKDGAVKRLIIFAFNYLSGKNSPGKIKAKWEKEILEFKKTFGKYPDGLSSHQHVHFFPFYFPVIVELYFKYGINYLRLGKETLSNRHIVAAILSILRKMNLALHKDIRFLSSDLLVSFDWIEEDYDMFFASIPQGKEMELIFHPERDEEMNFLENLLEENGSVQ